MAPYVYAALLDYGEISELDAESPVGWFAQTEVYFGVPVEWYQLVNGRWVFHEWGVITPFIFVDDDFSVPLGRSVFGFPKTLARVKKARSEWLKEPFAPVTLARVETVLFPELYKGKMLKSRVFLEVERDAPMSNFRIPFDANSLMAPWVIASKLAEGMAGFARDAMRVAQSMRTFEANPWMNPIFGAEMLNRLTFGFAPGGKGFTLNSLNLKQFRSSSDPEKISYQALTNGPMQVTALNGAGPLGEERIALGDLTGGYMVKLYDYSSLPIAHTLGLDVHRRTRGEGVDVLTLEPVMPFWANVNVKYLQGTNLVWRTSDGVWRGSNGEPLGNARTGYARGNESGRPDGGPHEKPVPQKRTADDTNWPLFNTTVSSAADQAIAGPFEFKGTVIRVLPLLADCEMLQTFVDDSINKALCNPGSTESYEFTVWSRPRTQYAYVYLTAATLGTVTSSTNNVGDWAKYELSFLIPVKLQHKTKSGSEVAGVGVVPVCIFVDTTIAAVSRTEILGIPTFRAEFERPGSVWLEEGKMDLQAKQTLLRVNTEVFTALREGQQAAVHPLIEISARDFAGIGEPDSLTNPDTWASILGSELESKNKIKDERHYEFRVARALAMEVLASPDLVPGARTDRRPPISFYALKQFRDAANPGKACYQALIQAPLLIDEISDVQEIEETLRIRIHEFPSLQLVEKLGLVAKTVYQKGAGIVYGLQPIRPFYIRANVRELDGVRLCWRAGSAEWMFDKPASEEHESRAVDLRAGRALDNGDPCQLKSFMHQSLTRRRPHGPHEPSVAAFIKNKLRSAKSADAYAKAERSLNQAIAKAKETVRKNCAYQFHELNKLTADAKDRDKTERKIEEIQAASLSQSEDLPTLYLKQLEDWQFRQGIGELEVSLALDSIDPQMVIEAILSREWANHNGETRWHKGLKELNNKLNALGGDIPFAHLIPPDPNSKKDPLTQAADHHAQVAREFYERVIGDQSNRPGWSFILAQIRPTLDNMGKFTRLRLEMEFHRDIVSTWNILPTQFKNNWGKNPNTLKQVKESTQKLVGKTREIVHLEIVGEPSNDDPYVSAIRNSLQLSIPKQKDVDEQLKQEIQPFGGPLVDAVLKATEIAGKYCDAQREALLNILAKAYQKPDFCVRRDSVASPAMQERYFPRSESWDDDWYAGGKRAEK